MIFSIVSFILFSFLAIIALYLVIGIMITYCLISNNMIILNSTEKLHIIYFVIISLYYYVIAFGCSKPRNLYAIIYLSVQ
jgi:hypothetical protein